MLANQARRFGETLVERHVLSRDDLEQAIDYYMQVNDLVLAERQRDRAFLATKIPPKARDVPVRSPIIRQI